MTLGAILALRPVAAVLTILTRVVAPLLAVVGPVILARLVILPALEPVLAGLLAPVLTALVVEAGAVVPVLEAVAPVVAAAVLLAAALVGLRLLAGIVLVAVGAVALAVRAGALTLVLAVLDLVLEGLAGIAGTRLRPVLILGARNDAEIVFAVLEVVLGGDRVARRQRVARELGVLVGDVLGGAADLNVGAVGFV
ncbi:hypothetical protein MET9862_04654 [Methylobacterium symbioticum]|uniref:Uncharacterized protein n=1 Tax=Methylobacterium symbioticum TaxID=2584084 RepID=A0A509EIN3_9HYPH|nr:hypothetical protein MET9862_04654 [Methylobacterium symbioticum]